MTLAIIIFAISFLLLALMLGGKWISMERGRVGAISSFLSSFDAPIARLLQRSALFTRLFIAFLWSEGIKFARRAQTSLFASTHRFLQNAEKKVRRWRDFAREQNIQPKAASSFLKDVVEYKAQLKHRQPL